MEDSVSGSKETKDSHVSKHSTVFLSLSPSTVVSRHLDDSPLDAQADVQADLSCDARTLDFPSTSQKL